MRPHSSSLRNLYANLTDCAITCIFHGYRFLFWLHNCYLTPFLPVEYTSYIPPHPHINWSISTEDVACCFPILSTAIARNMKTKRESSKHVLPRMSDERWGAWSAFLAQHHEELGCLQVCKRVISITYCILSTWNKDRLPWRKPATNTTLNMLPTHEWLSL